MPSAEAGQDANPDCNPPFLTIHDWFKHLQSQPTNSQWFTDHQKCLYRSILRSLHLDREYHTAVELLLLVMPSYMLDEANERWYDLLWDALVTAQYLRDRELQKRLLLWISEYCKMKGNESGAQTALNIVMEAEKSLELGD